MIKKNKYTVLKYSFFVLLILALSASYLVFFYNGKFNEVNKLIFPGIEGSKDFTLFNPMRMVNGDKEDAFTVVLSPGETFRGRLGIKNHDEVNGHTFFIKQVEGYSLGKKDKDGHYEKTAVNLSAPGTLKVNIDETLFELEPDGVLFVDYNITAPPDVSECDGEYCLFLVRFLLVKNDSSAQVIVSNGVKIDLGIGVPIKVILSKALPKYTYSDYSLAGNDQALKLTVERGRFLVAIILSFAIVVFVLKGFKKNKNS